MTGEIKTAYTTFSKKNNKYDMNTIFKKKFFLQIAVKCLRLQVESLIAAVSQCCCMHELQNFYDRANLFMLLAKIGYWPSHFCKVMRRSRSETSLHYMLYISQEISKGNSNNTPL